MAFLPVACAISLFGRSIGKVAAAIHDPDLGLLSSQEFMRHIKREFAKLVTVLQAYALISTGVRMICTNQVSCP